MKPITQEWVDKAEEDWNVLERLLRARKSPAHNTVCFHAQQCAEKYLKGRLQEASIAFPKTHDLDGLLNLVLAVEPQWHPLRPILQKLSGYAVLYRYPGFHATKAEARAARDGCRVVREQVRLSLGLPVV